MPAAAIAPGTVVDLAGVGAVTPTNTTVRINGSVVLTIGDVVSTHSSGDITHPANAIATGSTTVIINGKGIAYSPSGDAPLSGSLASCGGPVTSTFAPAVIVGV